MIKTIILYLIYLGLCWCLAVSLSKPLSSDEVLNEIEKEIKRS